MIVIYILNALFVHFDHSYFAQEKKAIISMLLKRECIQCW